jgi:hypothetical protein
MDTVVASMSGIGKTALTDRQRIIKAISRKNQAKLKVFCRHPVRMRGMANPTEHVMQAEDVRRNPNGTIDCDYYHQLASRIRTERSRAIGTGTAAVLRSLAGFLADRARALLAGRSKDLGPTASVVIAPRRALKAP